MCGNTITLWSIVGLLTQRSGQEVNEKDASLKVKLEQKWSILEIRKVQNEGLESLGHERHDKLLS